MIVRVIKGTLRPGSEFDAIRESSGEERAVALSVRRMWLFTREVDLVGPPCSAKLELAGDSNGPILPGSLLLGSERM